VFLSLYDDLVVVAEAADGQHAVDLCDQARPDVILMDLVMPVMDGPTAIKMIREKCPHMQVIALTNYVDEQNVQRAIQAGAIGYMLKDVHADRLAEAIREAHRGRGTIDAIAAQALVDISTQPLSPGENLTDREKEILGLMTTGATNKEIAHQLTISLGTVRFHVSNILQKMGVSNRTEAASLALQNGLVEKG